jgi:hypothetical protein
MIVMYGAPPDRRSERVLEAIKKHMQPQSTVASAPVTGMTLIIHNPFTGEPINLLEVLAQNAKLTDERAKLELEMRDLKSENETLLENHRIDRSYIAEQKKSLAETNRQLAAAASIREADCTDYINAIKMHAAQAAADGATISALQQRISVLEAELKYAVGALRGKKREIR